MKLVSGRSFNESYSTDKEACMVNESAVKNFHKRYGKDKIYYNPGSGKGRYLQVIGVVKNFNFESLRNPIGLIYSIFKTDEYIGGYFSVKLSALNYSKTISAD